LASPIEPLSEGLFLPFAGEESAYKLLSTEAFVNDCQSDKARLWRSLGSHATITEQMLKNYEACISLAEEATAEVRCPTLVVSGGQDRVLKPGNSDLLFERLVSSDGKARYHSPNSGHAVPIDHGRKSVFNHVGAFLQSADETEDTRF
jgi:esterase/lipase